MHEQVCCHDEAANHQLPIAAAFWIIWIISVEECSSLTQKLMQVCGSTHSVILNVTATQYTCSLNSIYRPHWLVQWVVIVHAAHPSSLSLAARLYWCCTSHSCINNGCTFSRQTSYIHVYVYNIRNIYYQGIIGKFFRYNNVIVLFPHPFRGTNLNIYKMGEKAGNGKEDEKKWVGIHSP